MNASSPEVDCFLSCAKVCGCVAFQLSGSKCELLDAAKDVAVGDLVIRPGSAFLNFPEPIARLKIYS